MKTNITRVLFLVILVVFGMAANSWATLTYELGYNFSGTVDPSSTTPWLTAVFDDGGGTGSVTLSLTATNLASGEYVSGFYFNLDPAFVPANLTITPNINNSVTTTISKGTNGFKADGDGKYDVLFEYPTPNIVTDPRFASGTLTYTIELAGLTENSFNFLSAPAGGAGPYYVAAHIQGIADGTGGTTSAWVTTPIPSSVWLLGSSLIGLICFGRRKTRNFFA